MADQAKLERTPLRTKITKAYRQACADSLSPSVNLDWVKTATDTLLDYDLLIDDEPEVDYYERLRYVKAHLQEKARLAALAETEARDAQQKAEEAQRQAAREEAAAQWRATEQAELAAEEKAHRRTLREAEIAALTARASTASTSPHIPDVTSPKHKKVPTEARPEPFDGRPSSYRSFERSFECAYETNNAYAEYDRFTIFKNLVGTHGRHLVATLQPTADGLKTAKERMRSTFNPPLLVRKDVTTLLESLPFTKSSLNTAAMNTLLFTFERGVDALLDCGTDSKVIDISYLPLITKRLPRELLQRYREKYTELTTTQFVTFLRKTIADEEWINETQDLTLEEPRQRSRRAGVNTLVASSGRTTPPNRPQPRPPSSVEARGPPRAKCVFCDGTHVRFYCDQFDPAQYRAIARQKQLCLVCLLPGHTARDCSSTYRCTTCGDRHSRMVCAQPPTQGSTARRAAFQQRHRPRSPSIRRSQSLSLPSSSSATLPSATTTTVTAARVNTLSTLATTASQTLPETSNAHVNAVPSTSSTKDRNFESYLMTAMVTIKGQPVRVFLDFGATRSLITKQLATQLDLPVVAHQNLTIGGWDGFHGATSQSLVGASLTALDGLSWVDTELSLTDNLQVPLDSFPAQLREEIALKGITLCGSAYPSFQQYPVQIILGAEYCAKIVPGARIQLDDNLFVYETTFGWVPYGTRATQSGPRNQTAVVNLLTTSHVNTKSVMSEENYTSFLDSNPADSHLEQEYLSSYIDNHVHFRNGHYSVDLPFLEPIRLTSNEQGALNRFQKLMIMLSKKRIREKYVAAMAEMLEFAELAPERLPPDKCFYLPHHCVLRPDKDTTQTRVVLDGSAHDKDSASINDNFFKGIVGWDALATFLKFRLGKYAICADVKKAFWQVQIEPHHRDYLRFWWINDDGRPTVYRFKVLPFGLSCSPFVLYAVQQHMFRHSRQNYHAVVSRIEKSFYVDDLLHATNEQSLQQVDHLRTQTTELFAAHGMELRKWRTNIPSLDSIWAPHPTTNPGVLGFDFDVVTDTLHYKLSVDRYLTMITTKRSFASFMASIYDPPGYLAPYIVRLRLFTRKLWTDFDVNWDDPLPEAEHIEAMKLINEAGPISSSTTIRRNVLPPDGVPTNLVIFADASTKAIGVAVYVQSGLDSNLFFAKCKLARKTTIVELELEALVTASKIGQHLQKLHPFSHTIVCGDSLLNLQRLAQHPNKQKVHIALKVDKVLRLKDASFRHVRSKLNIADLITRGCTVTELLENQSWWKGPPIDPITRFDQTLNKQAIVCFTNTKTTCSCFPFHSYESAVNSFRILANWALRHCKSDSLAEYASRTDIELAVVLLISSIQREHFATEIDLLKKPNGRVPPTSPLRRHNCVVDKLGLLRLQTRFSSSPILAPEHLSPIILPEHCSFTQIIILFEHARAGHPGLERTIGAFRDRYFSIGIRRTTRTLLNRCKICNVVRPNLPRVDYGSVPAFRYDASTPPFTNTGVDLFGPLKINMTTPGKRYAIIFSCATTRAVHLEIVRDMTAREVFLALRRFTSRRRTPDLFYSDNGRQLLAVRKELQKLIAEFSNKNPGREIRFQWQLITAAAPWRAGFYERLIGVIKRFLMAFTYTKQIDDVELATLMVEVEARMNSRPLFVYNGTPITPAHFFGGSEQTHLPVLARPKKDEKRPQIVKDFLQQQNHLRKIWVAWIDKYLLQLRQFHQNIYVPNSPRSFKPGDVVLLKNFTAVDLWPLGIIDSVKPSSDGKIRTAFVRTTDRGRIVIKPRDVRTLVPLECAHEQLEFETTSAEPTPDNSTPDDLSLQDVASE